MPAKKTAAKKKTAGKKPAASSTKKSDDTQETTDRTAAWTPEKRRDLSDKLKAYYKDHDAPMKGKTLTDETKELIRQKALDRKPIGVCSACGRSLFTPEAAAAGIGPICAANAVAS